MAGQLVKRGKNVWLVRVYLGRNNDGKRKWHNHTVHGRKEDAQAYLTAYLRDRDLGRAAPASRITLDDLLDRYLASSADRLAIQSWMGYSKTLKGYVRPELGYIRLDRLTTWEIQAFYDKLRERGLSPRTIRYVHTCLSSALNQAVQWRLLSDNPAKGTVRPKGGPRQARRPKVVLTREQALQFLDAVRRHVRGVLYELALVTGMRPEEYLGLTWPCVDWRQNRLRVERVLVRIKGEHPRKDLEGVKWSLNELPKTTTSRRTIEVPPQLMDRLKEWRKRQLEEQGRAGSRYQRNNLVFATPEGLPLWDWTVARGMKTLLRQAGLPQMGLYDLRRTCTTLLLEAGEHVKVIAERLGHSGVTLTQDEYAQLLPTMQAGAARRLTGILYPEDDVAGDAQEA